MVDILNKDGRLFTTNSFTNSNTSMNHSKGNTVYMYYVHKIPWKIKSGSKIIVSAVLWKF